MNPTSSDQPVTLVTGASSGIGLEIARLAAAESRVLVVVARRLDRLEALADELRNANEDLEVLPRSCDLSDETAIDGLLADLKRRGLEIDILVNNAGLGDVGSHVNVPPERRRLLLDVNIRATCRLLDEFLPGMAERGRGRALNVASTAAFQPLPNFATYAASKAFVLHLSEALWVEYRKRGVTVTCLCPGFTDTEYFTANQGYENVPMDKFSAMPADAVARAGWRGMKKGKRLVVPGLLNKISWWLAPALPRRLTMSIGGKIFGKSD